MKLKLGQNSFALSININTMNKKKLLLFFGLSLHGAICFAGFSQAKTSTFGFHQNQIGLHNQISIIKPAVSAIHFKNSFGIHPDKTHQSIIGLMNKKQNSFMLEDENKGFVRNRRNMYSSLWAFATLNYLYADIAGLMDAHMLQQYMTGNVDGAEITPGFLTAAAAFMQIPIANVFLPHVIKNDRTLRWVQLSSGAVMSLAQAGTLFWGKPTPYYLLFSVLEIAATTFITVDAIRWKPQKPLPQQF